MQQRALDGVDAHLLLHPGEARGSQAEASAAVLCHPGLRPVMGWEHVAFVAGPQRLQNLATRLVIPAQAALCAFRSHNQFRGLKINTDHLEPVW
jgi:hypothetical protein